jgi:hypothetical protein
MSSEMDIVKNIAGEAKSKLPGGQEGPVFAHFLPYRDQRGTLAQGRGRTIGAHSTIVSKGGERAYKSRLGKDRNACQSCHFVATANQASPPIAEV